MESIKTIAKNINELSTNYKIGSLQGIRKDLKKLDRQPGEKIFQTSTVFDNWAFHYGGRKELQFNIGIEPEGIRYGIAFSLKRSQSLQDISILFPKILRLNQFIRENPEFFKEYRMWSHYGKRSKIGPVIEIKSELMQDGTFIFIGKILEQKINYEEVLITFDELLEPYLFVESDSTDIKKADSKTNGFEFQPKAKKLTARKKYSSVEKSIDLDVRHTLIQEKLQEELEREYGHENVSVENPCNGKKIDLVLKINKEFQFYEIKTASSAKACIREAMGQLLEYAYWPATVNAQKIIIVGEYKIDSKTEEYLIFLRKSFKLPIEYITIKI
jgi:hypothetical protein